MEIPLLSTPTQAAKIVGLSARKFRDLVAAKRIEAVMLGGHYTRLFSSQPSDQFSIQPTWRRSRRKYLSLRLSNGHSTRLVD